MAQRHFCPTGPTCRSCHSRPARFIFVGLIDLSADSVSPKRTDVRSRMSVASTSGLRLPSSVRHVITLTTRRSCLGLCLLQGCRARVAVHRERARPRSRSPAPGDPTPAMSRAAARSPIRSWVFGASFPNRNADRPRELLAAVHIPALRQMLLARRRRPFSVLMGLMPSFTRPA